MTGPSPERRAELRNASLGRDSLTALTNDLVALLDAADERDRLRAAVRQIADACHWSHDPSGDPEALVAHIGQLQQIAEDACDERDRLLTVADTLGRVNGEYAMEIHRCREALGVDEDTDPHHAAQALTAAAEWVRALHVADGEGFCRCCDYMTPHPCATLRALDGADDKASR